MIDPRILIAAWFGAETVAVIWLLTAVHRGQRVLQWLAKPAASAIFVVFGLSRADFSSAFDRWMVLGLFLGLVGDVLLIEFRTFRLGLVTFLAGHVAYILAFDQAQGWSTWPVTVILPLAATAGVAAFWLWPHAGKMQGAVMAYILIICLMAWGGIGLSFSGVLPMTAGIGAMLFFLSDVAVARHQFVKKEFINKAVGLPAYYAGQMLLAMTIGWSA